MERRPSEAVSRYLAEIGRKGGRSKKVSAEQRRVNARRAALGRWRKISNLKPIWEVAADLVAGIPEAELRELPVDGARQLDHYLYGTPKSKR